MLGKKFYEKRFSPYPFPKSFLIFIRLYGVLYYHPKLATVSLDALSPEGHIARDVRAYRTFVYRVCPRQTYRAELCEAFLSPSSRRCRSWTGRRLLSIRFVGRELFEKSSLPHPLSKTLLIYVLIIGVL